MIEAPIQNPNIISHLDSLESDGMTVFLLEHGTVRGTLLHGTRMINQMRENHRTGILETLALGHGYLAAGLMTSMIKGDDRIGVHLECGGPIGGITAEASAHGDVRGYLKHNPIEITEPPESFDLSPYIGPGFLTVTKFIQDARQPYYGQIMLEHGSVAKDLAEYFLQSEQTKTLFFLSVQFDRQGDAVGAGGLFLQALPGADDSALERVSSRALSMPSLGDYFSRGEGRTKLLLQTFENPEVLADRPVQFFCHCTKTYYSEFITSLSGDTREDIRKNGPFPMNISCRNCASEYAFSREEIETLLS